MENKIDFICHAVKWHDRINGNTYHSVRVTRCRDGQQIVGQYQYGYGSAYHDTALMTMFQNKWIPKKYNKDNLYLFQREKDYPIFWIETYGTKKECIANGTLTGG